MSGAEFRTLFRELMGVSTGREQLQEIADNEIESNWDQVVDKYDLKCLLTLYMRLKCTCLTQLRQHGAEAGTSTWYLCVWVSVIKHELIGLWLISHSISYVLYNREVLSVRLLSSSAQLSPLSKVTMLLRRRNQVQERPQRSPFPSFKSSIRQ